MVETEGMAKQVKRKSVKSRKSLRKRYNLQVQGILRIVIHMGRLHPRLKVYDRVEISRFGVCKRIWSFRVQKGLSQYHEQNHPTIDPLKHFKGLLNLKMKIRKMAYPFCRYVKGYHVKIARVSPLPPPHPPTTHKLVLLG